MAKYANAGALDTIITIQNRNVTADNPSGYDIRQWYNVFGGNIKVWCLWVNAYGNERLEAYKIGLKEPATVTMRYSPLITATCRILKDNGMPFSVISVNDVGNHHEWLELKVTRGAEAV